MNVQFWFDPGCPFSWVTSRWVASVAPERDLDVTWQPFSLFLKNNPPESSPFYNKSRSALRLLRIVESERQSGNGDAAGPLYAAFGREIHNNSSIDFNLAEVLSTIGLDPALAYAADDSTLDAGILTAMANGAELVGDDTGTPIVAIETASGWVGYSGPILTALPENPAAVWDAFATLASTPEFSEMKRPRTTGPTPPPESVLDQI